MSEHRVTMLGASWRRFEDPARSRDPRVRAVVGALATLPAVEPRAEFRAELRTQLVAIAPRVVAESAEIRTALLDPVPVAASGRAGAGRGARHADTFLTRLRGVRLGRTLTVTASIVTAFVVLLGGAVWMSRNALPGDTLYGLKRASENFELATAGSDTERAKDHLKFAAARAREVQTLLAHRAVPAAGPGPAAVRVDPETARLVASTLSSADHDVTSASVLLGKQAVKKGSTAPLAAMTKWAPEQLNRLRDIAAVIPTGALRDRTMSSANLVTAALTRAETLAPKVDCSCLNSAGVDTLGPVPCGTCPPGSGSGKNPANQGPGVGTKGGSNGTASGGASGPAANSSQDRPHTSLTPTQPAASSGSSGHSSPAGPLPTIKLPTSSPPVNVSSCSIGASLGPLSLNIGLCSLGLGLHP